MQKNNFRKGIFPVKKLKNFITATMVCVMMATSAMTVSAAEVPADSASAVESHVHDLDECELNSTYKACDHNGTLKGTTYVGTCSRCGGFLYYVYCKVCGRYTGATICLCR